MIPRKLKNTKFKFYRKLFWFGVLMICIGGFIFFQNYSLDSFEFGIWTWIGGAGLIFVLGSFSAFYETEAGRDLLTKDFIIRADQNEPENKD